MQIQNTFSNKKTCNYLYQQMKPLVWYYLQPNLGFGSNKHFFPFDCACHFPFTLSWLKVEKFFMKIPFCVFITYTCYFYGTHSLRKVTHSLWKKLLIVKKEITEWQKRKSNRRRRGLYDAKRSLKFRMRRLQSWELSLGSFITQKTFSGSL